MKSSNVLTWKFFQQISLKMLERKRRNNYKMTRHIELHQRLEIAAILIPSWAESFGSQSDMKQKGLFLAVRP
jgi:hypothetical protein